MRSVLVIFIILLIFHGIVKAEIYKYKASDGTIAYTDDLSQVPEDQRSTATIMPQIDNSDAGSDDQQGNEIDNHLSWKDKELIAILKQKGVIAKDAPEKEITHEYLEYTKLMLKREMGIEDITTWQPDRRLDSPEHTFELYKQGLISHDLDLILKCIMPRMWDLHKEMFKKMSADKLRQIGEEMTQIQKIVAEEGYAKYRIKRKEEHNGKEQDITYRIYFVYVLGEWRIEQF